ncbi:MAG TPA: hypothetical protein VF815_02685 [Myxococcaceae bacterium]|jgi:hypothetical protein
MRARWAALGLLLLAACRGVPWRPEALNQAARVEAMELRFAPDGTGLLTLKLEVRNPASDAALLTEVDFELAVDGQRLAMGLQQVEVPLGHDGLAHTVELSFPLVSEGAVSQEPGVMRKVQLRGGALLRYGASTERRAPFTLQRQQRVPYVPLPEAPLE